MSTIANIADMKPFQRQVPGINGRSMTVVNVDQLSRAEAEAYVERLREKYFRGRREMPLDPSNDVWIPR
jgi:hypothetical protein